MLFAVPIAFLKKVNLDKTVQKYKNLEADSKEEYLMLSVEEALEWVLSSFQPLPAERPQIKELEKGA